MRVLESAARFQELVPDAVLVGGSAAALYAGHRDSYDHDADETLRVKGFLIVRRNQARDYLDVAALADRYGLDRAVKLLASIDDYYADQHTSGDGVASQLQIQLADPRPKDISTTRQLSRYKNLAPRWHDWNAVTSVCHRIAECMMEG